MALPEQVVVQGEKSCLQYLLQKHQDWLPDGAPQDLTTLKRLQHKCDAVAGPVVNMSVIP